MSLGSLLLVVSCVCIDGFAAGFLPCEYILPSYIYIIVFISADTDFLFILAVLCELH